MLFRHLQLKISVLSFIALFAFVSSPAQVATPASSLTGPQPLTDRVLYRQFLAYQKHLDTLALNVDQRGKNGDQFRNHFQDKLGFSSLDFQPVRASAGRLDVELKALDAQAKAIVDATRAKFPQGTAARPAILPPVPPELTALQQQKNTLIDSEIKTLQSQLGSEKAAKLDTLIHADFAPHVTVNRVTLPHPLDPKKYPVPSFRPEVQK